MNEEVNKNTPDENEMPAKNSMTIGQFLRQERTKKNLDLAFVAQRTCINLNVLKALENNDLEKVPRPTYIKGFVKSIARELGIDVNTALEHLENTYRLKKHSETGMDNSQIHTTISPVQTSPIPSPDLQNAVSFETVAEKENKKTATADNQPSMVSQKTYDDLVEMAQSVATSWNLSWSKVFFITIGIVLTVSFARYLYELFPKMTAHNLKEEVQVQEQQPPPSSPSGATVPGQSTLGQDMTVIGPTATTDKTGLMTIPNSNTTITPVSSPITPASMANPQKEISPSRTEATSVSPDKKIIIKKFGGISYNPDASSPENNDPHLLPQNIKNSLRPGAENIYIKALENNTWVAYKKDKEPVKAMTLAKGQSLLIQGELIRLFLGNLQTAKVFYNNHVLKMESKYSVKSMVFPKNRAKEFYIPLFIVDEKEGKIYSSDEYFEKYPHLKDDSNIKR